MSGPALMKVDSHAAIHEAALQEARDLTNMIENLLKEGDSDKALEVAYIAVEHWETRTLAHADAEEKGLYKRLVEDTPELSDEVVALKRDHDLLKLLVKDIKKVLTTKGIRTEVIERFRTLILIDELHNQKEEEVLPEQ